MVLLTTCRAQRPDLTVELGTPLVVGPGRYEHEVHGPTSDHRTGAAFSLSQSQRPGMATWRTSSVTPGPDTYSVRRVESEPSLEMASRTNALGSGASPFRSRSGRCDPNSTREPLMVPGSGPYRASSILDNPGPGTYDPKEPVVKRAAPAPKGLEEGPARVLVLSQSSPSIPPGKDPKSFNATGRPGDTIGPNHYNLEHHTALKTGVSRVGATSPAAMTNFHQSRAERDWLPKECSIDNTRPPDRFPGPGAYSNVRKKLTKGTSCGFLSGTPQLATAQPYRSKSSSTALTPGPGGYDPPDFASFVEPALDKDGRPQKGNAGLASAVSRDGWWRPLEEPFTDSDAVGGRVPDPGTYYQHKLLGPAKRARSSRSNELQDFQRYHGVHAPSLIMSLKKTDAALNASFYNTAQRDCLKEDKPTGAGPGTYDPNASMGQSIAAGMKEKTRIGAGGAFGSTKTGNRFAQGMLDKCTKNAGPDAVGEYEFGSSVDVDNDPAGMAFRSGTPQLAPDYTVDRIPKPGPGEYSPRLRNTWSLKEAEADLQLLYPDAPRDPAATRRRNKFRQPRKDHLCFGSAKKRFEADAMETDKPPPGEYDVRKPLGDARKAPRFPGTKRNLEPKAKWELEQDPDSVRGPGMYQLPGAMKVNTFNISGEKVAQMLIRQATRGVERKLALRDTGEAWTPKPQGFAPDVTPAPAAPTAWAAPASPQGGAEGEAPPAAASPLASAVLLAAIAEGA